MIEVTKDTFAKVMRSLQCDSVIESDADYTYETFLDSDGETVGIIARHDFEGETYSLYGEAEACLHEKSVD